MIYIAIGKFGWGRGKTSRDALREMRKHVAQSDRNIYVVFSCADDDATVTQMGNLHAKIAPVEIERKNWPDPKPAPETQGRPIDSLAEDPKLPQYFKYLRTVTAAPTNQDAAVILRHKFTELSETDAGNVVILFMFAG